MIGRVWKYGKNYVIGAKKDDQQRLAKIAGKDLVIDIQPLDESQLQTEEMQKASLESLVLDLIPTKEEAKENVFKQNIQGLSYATGTLLSYEELKEMLRRLEKENKIIVYPGEKPKAGPTPRYYCRMG